MAVTVPEKRTTRRAGHIGVFWCDAELYDIDTAVLHAQMDGCTHLYWNKRLYKIDASRRYIPVCDHNIVGEYLQDVIVNGVEP